MGHTRVEREYLVVFGPGFIGLSGTTDDSARGAQEFRVYCATVPTGSGYTIDHSAQT